MLAINYPIFLVLIFTLLASCNHSEQIEKLTSDINKLQKENDSIKFRIILYDRENAKSLFIDTVDSMPFFKRKIVTSFGKIIDPRDGKQYKTITIGSQTWMAENLNYVISGSWCYEGDLDYCKSYGRLYDYETVQNACPAGWKVPSKNDWEILIGQFMDINAYMHHQLFNSKHIANIYPGEDIAWSTLKFEGNIMDITDTREAFDALTSAELGFNPQFGGLRLRRDFDFVNRSYEGNYWTDTECDEQSAFGVCFNRMTIGRGRESVSAGYTFGKSSGLSCRCIEIPPTKMNISCGSGNHLVVVPGVR